MHLFHKLRQVLRELPDEAFRRKLAKREICCSLLFFGQQASGQIKVYMHLYVTYTVGQCVEAADKYTWLHCPACYLMDPRVRRSRSSAVRLGPRYSASSTALSATSWKSAAPISSHHLLARTKWSAQPRDQSQSRRPGTDSSTSSSAFTAAGSPPAASHWSSGRPAALQVSQEPGFISPAALPDLLPAPRRLQVVTPRTQAAPAAPAADSARGRGALEKAGPSRCAGAAERTGVAAAAGARANAAIVWAGSWAGGEPPLQPRRGGGAPRGGLSALRPGASLASCVSAIPSRRHEVWLAIGVPALRRRPSSCRDALLLSFHAWSVFLQRSCVRVLNADLLT